MGVHDRRIAPFDGVAVSVGALSGLPMMGDEGVDLPLIELLTSTTSNSYVFPLVRPVTVQSVVGFVSVQAGVEVVNVVDVGAVRYTSYEYVVEAAVVEFLVVSVHASLTAPVRAVAGPGIGDGSGVA